MELEQINLWGDSEETVKVIIGKVKKPKKVSEKPKSKKSMPLKDALAQIRDEVYSILGKYAENTVCITTREDLFAYISAAIENGVIAIDTETNNTLNTFDCKLMGLCLYTPGQKNAYVPVSHVDEDGNLLQSQVTCEDIRLNLQRVLDNDLFEVYHNASFDIEVLMTTCGIRMKAWWDTLVGAQLIDENELKSLKAQYKLHIDDTQEKYNIEHLFKGFPYEVFDPQLFALYAATDAYMTYRLFEYQRDIFRRPENKDVYELFKTIEIPVIDAVVDMEMSGVTIDIEYANILSPLYHRQSDDILVQINEELDKLKPLIDSWRLTPEANHKPEKTNKKGEKTFGKSMSEQLTDPINVDSPSQLAILLYDIMHVDVVDKEKPRGTGKEILDELAYQYPICKLIADKRAVDILIDTFIDKMPAVMQKDGKVHARFNQCGTATGRFASADPNLQNIPSQNKLIRMMFKASPGYSIIGGDFSGQEPRSLCAFSKDKTMQRAYEEKRDLYATMATKCFHNDYGDNLEFHPDTGALQPEGKERRSKAKTVFLGTSYSMGAAKLAKRMNLSIAEAEQIIHDLYAGFPEMAAFKQASEDMARKLGYVTDFYGRRRHLPDAMLPTFQVTPINPQSTFNPLIGTSDRVDAKTEAQIKDYIRRLEAAKWNKERNAIIADAEKHGFKVKNNGGFIARAQRQSLNARIQGTAASMTKSAMVKIVNDQEMKRLGFKLLVTIHDEVFGEVPTENSAAAAKRLCELMIEAAKEKCSFTPWAVDPYIVKRWYLDEVSGKILEKYNKKLNKGLSQEDAFEEIKTEYSVIQEKYLRMMCDETFDCNAYEDI